MLSGCERARETERDTQTRERMENREKENIQTMGEKRRGEKIETLGKIWTTL